jgi:hypothetical protein
MQRPLGQSGISVTDTGFCTWALGGNPLGSRYGISQTAQALEALETAYDVGCTFFETADFYGYGHSERLLGQCLPQWDRARVVIGGKTFYPLANSLTDAVFASLKRLNTDYFDLYQLHLPTPFIRPSDWQELLTLQNKGWIRALGVSLVNPTPLPTGWSGLSAVQLPWDYRLSEQDVQGYQQNGWGVIIRPTSRCALDKSPDWSGITSVIRCFQSAQQVQEIFLIQVKETK